MPALTLMLKPASGHCDMNCAYCFYRDEASRRATPDAGIMSTATLEAILRRAFAFADGAVTIIFQGGEPTLAGEEFYREYLRLLRRYNSRRLPVNSSLQTNGLNITPGMLEVLIQGRFLVGVSLDGAPATHNSYRVDQLGNPTHARIIGNIEAMRARGIDVNVLCVVTDRVAAQPHETFNALARYEYMQFITCLSPEGECGVANAAPTPEQYGRFLTETFGDYCAALNSGRHISVREFDNYITILRGGLPENCGQRGVCGAYYLIEADGTVYPCDFYALDEYCIGNIHADSFPRLARSEVGERFRNEARPTPMQCVACEWKQLCHGGCKRERPAFDRPTVWCESYKTFFENCVARLSMLAECGVSMNKPASTR